MSRTSEPVCRLCRVEKTKLFLKGNKCIGDKCPIERRAYAPGQHGRSRKRVLGYAVQLREKQKLKRYYAMSERQKGVTGENLLTMLERRLDNVVFLMGFSRSRAQSRQLVTHGHFQVNGHKVTIPSYLVDEGDAISFKERSSKNEETKTAVSMNKNKTLPGWLDVDWENLQGRVLALPTRADIQLPVEEHLVVELYSK